MEKNRTPIRDCDDLQGNYNCNCNDPVTRSVGISINQPCDGTTRMLFEDITDTEGFYQVEVYNYSSTPSTCTMTVTLELANGTTVERTVTRQVELFVDNLRRASIRCQGNPTGTCSGSLYVYKTFRFCCTDE